MTCLSVCLSPGVTESTKSSVFIPIGQFGLGKSSTSSVPLFVAVIPREPQQQSRRRHPSRTPAAVPADRSESHNSSGNRVWDSFPTLGSQTPMDPRLPTPGSQSGIPWDPRQTPVDPRLDCRLGFPGIPDLLISRDSWDSKKPSSGSRRIVIYHQYQDLDNQNSKHKIKACRNISSSNSILKIDSIFFMALMY